MATAARAVTVPSMDISFEYDSATSTPYITAPSSPQTSSISDYFHHSTNSHESFHDLSFISDIIDGDDQKTSAWHDDPRFSIAFEWEVNGALGQFTHSATHSKGHNDMLGLGDGEEDFKFDFVACSDATSPAATADELFLGGKIRPLESAPLSPRSDHFSASTFASLSSSPASRFSHGINSTVEPQHHGSGNSNNNKREKERGRERNIPSSSCSSPGFGRRGTRSLSPLRIADILLDYDDDGDSDGDDGHSTLNTRKNASSTPSCSFSASSNYFSSLVSFSKGEPRKKWSFRDLLLFRSASEGRGTSKDPFRKYSPGFGSHSSSSSRTPSPAADGSRSRRSGETESTHELHYRMKRAASEERKRRTTLAYKHGFMACMGGGSLTR